MLQQLFLARRSSTSLRPIEAGQAPVAMFAGMTKN
jgi:hypothetical protein